MDVDISDYLPRYVDTAIEDAIQTMGAVAVEGPKWCGKTWSCLRHAKSSFMVGDPANNFSNRRLAQTNVSLVLPGEAPRLIDEWQEAPSIWDAVRMECDRRGRKGQFLLSGSSTPQRKGVLHSGTGRIDKLRMRPMSLYESGDSSGEASLLAMFDGVIDASLTGEVELRRLIRLILRGGWPGNIDAPEGKEANAPRAYVKTVLDEDLDKLDDVAVDAVKMRLLLRSLARNESTTAAKATLRKDIIQEDGDTLDDETITKYLGVLGRMFLIDDQPPFSPSIRSSVRVKQRAKRHLADPSLAAALLGATPERLMGDLDTLGFLFEALVERDLRIYAEADGGALFHYQDYRGREIDAVIEMPDGRWGAFEVKLGANQIDVAAEGLLRLRREFEAEGRDREPCVLCVVCGLSNAAYRRPDGVYVVPPTALRA